MSPRFRRAAEIAERIERDPLYHPDRQEVGKLLRDTVASELTRDHVFALTTRSDLVEQEARIVGDENLTWRGRLKMLGDYGTRGGSAGDRRLIVEAFALLEEDRR